MKLKYSLLMASFAAAATLTTVTAAPSFAQVPTVAAAQLADQAFFKKKYRIKGTWSIVERDGTSYVCLLYTSPSPRDRTRSRMPSSA